GNFVVVLQALQSPCAAVLNLLEDRHHTSADVQQEHYREGWLIFAEVYDLLLDAVLIDHKVFSGQSAASLARAAAHLRVKDYQLGAAFNDTAGAIGLLGLRSRWESECKEESKKK